MTEVDIVRTDIDGYESRVRSLVREYFAYADRLATERFGDRLDGLDVEAAADGDLERLRDPAIARPLVLALAGDRVVGIVQLKRLSGVEAEVKRLYVVPSRRGEGTGRRLLERTIEAAREDGFETLRLGVGPYLDRARALYRDLGFEETPPYEGTNCPEPLHEDWQFMRLDLE